MDRAAQRLTEEVRRNEKTGCLEWQGKKTPNGYGSLRRKKEQLAHRVAWAVRNGAIPPDLCVCHTCDNRICVEVEHLWLGTKGENNTDRHLKGRSRAGALPGERNHRAKLTREIVLAIRADRRPLLDVAATYGLSFQHVSAIRLRQRWAHL